MSRTKLPENIAESLIEPEDGALVSLRYSASLLGIGADTVRNWDIPEKYSKYKPIVYSLRDVIKAYCQKKDLKISRLKEKLSLLESSETDWKSNLNRALTKSAQLKNAQLQSKLIAYAPMQFYLLNIVQKFISAIDDVPSRVSPKVMGCKNRQAAYLLLQDEMRIIKSALAELSLEHYDNKPIDEEPPTGFQYDKESDTFIRESEEE